MWVTGLLGMFVCLDCQGMKADPLLMREVFLALAADDKKAVMCAGLRPELQSTKCIVGPYHGWT